ncbi:MAG TPA: hypothetical protein VL551_25425 [Actinospica sp.]|jgi:hypothetical protein|nr:hypothetical protein [Actinospica sp.]
MSGGWVAGTVRARSLVRRAIGDAGSHDLAAGPALSDALLRLSATSYGRGLSADATLAEAEHTVGDAALWNLRVLAGWLPRAGLTVLSVLAADYEIRNVADRLLALTGRPVPAPYELGALARAWGSAAGAGSPAEVRGALTSSPWGDPGSAEPAALLAGLRLSTASRLAELHDATRPWGCGLAAIVYARERFLRDAALPASDARVAATIGPAARAADWPGFVASLPARSADWPFEGLAEPSELWRAEERWWTRVRRDSERLLHAPGFGPEIVIGCAQTLLADAHGVCAALEAVSRDGHGIGDGHVRD